MTGEAASVGRVPPAVAPVRVGVWVMHLALPMVGLWLLLAQPRMDMTWHNAVSHFVLIIAVAGINVVLGVQMGRTARRHDDARLLLVSLAFLSAAGFLLVHAVATPGVLIGHPNAGFDLAQPIGLMIAAGFAVASAVAYGPRASAALVRGQVAWQGVLGALLVAWAVVSLLPVGPLHVPESGEVDRPLLFASLVSIGLFAIASLRYYLLYRKAPAAMLLSIVTAFALLAEAMVAVSLADNWHLSWWTWHALLTCAFGFVAYSAYVQYQREGASVGVFDAITLSQTAWRLRQEYGEALDEFVAGLEARADGPSGAAGAPIAARVADRFGLSERQTAVLERAGTALAVQRSLGRRLAALVEIGERARVGVDEDSFLQDVRRAITPAFPGVRLTIGADAEGEQGGLLRYPITVKGLVAGSLTAPDEPDPAMVAALANQVSIGLENVRLYKELGTLFRHYLSPDVAAALLADPSQAELGGSLVDVTALFADLRGFTTFSEAVEPAEIVAMLNRYHSAAVPCVLENGGTIVQFVGDALLALFNAPARQEHHEVQAVRAALAMQVAVDRIASGEPTWPRFRVGVNTGPALVGNIGSERLRGFNAMGDAVNVASRLQGLAEPGQVVIGEATRLALPADAHVRDLGDLAVKGRRQPVRAFVITSLGSLP
jgi:adenylate cyclase